MKCRRFGLSGGLTLYSDSKSAKRYLEKIYGGDRCLICGWNKTPNEVCHIIPAKVGGQTKVENLILLCPNHHKMYDRGLIPLQTVLAAAKKMAS
jgi:predicted restriction endonuclease